MKTDYMKMKKTEIVDALQKTMEDNSRLKNGAVMIDHQLSKKDEELQQAGKTISGLRSQLINVQQAIKTAAAMRHPSLSFPSNNPNYAFYPVESQTVQTKSEKSEEEERLLKHLYDLSALSEEKNQYGIS